MLIVITVFQEDAGKTLKEDKNGMQTDIRNFGFLCHLAIRFKGFHTATGDKKCDPLSLPQTCLKYKIS